MLSHAWNGAPSMRHCSEPPSLAVMRMPGDGPVSSPWSGKITFTVGAVVSTRNV